MAYASGAYHQVVGIEIRHFRVLLAVVDAGSMSRAAEELGLTQPSITRAMRELERHFGVELLNRAGRGATPTEAGAQFAAIARRVVDTFGIAVNSPIQTPALRIAYAWAGLIPTLEDLLKTWNTDDTHNAAQMIRVDNPLSALATATADLALMREWTSQPGHHHLDIHVEPRVVAVSTADALAQRPRVHVNDLASYGLVINTSSGTTPADLWGAPRNRTVDIRTRDVEDWVYTIATTSGVVGITPASTAEFYHHPGLTYLPYAALPRCAAHLSGSATTPLPCTPLSLTRTRPHGRTERKVKRCQDDSASSRQRPSSVTHGSRRITA